jgi:hypothetical protein
MKNEIQQIGYVQHAMILLFVLVGVTMAIMDFWTRKEAVKGTDLPQETLKRKVATVSSRARRSSRYKSPQGGEMPIFCLERSLQRWCAGNR